jgi:hypothetical protein
MIDTSDKKEVTMNLTLIRQQRELEEEKQNMMNDLPVTLFILRYKINTLETAIKEIKFGKEEEN